MNVPQVLHPSSRSETRISPISTLPVEILEQIITFACATDANGGATARSLSLVSKHVSAITRPYLFHAVAITGMASLTKFLGTFLRLQKPWPIVRSLFLSDRRQEEASDCHGFPGRPLWSQNDNFYSSLQREEKKLHYEARNFFFALREIISYLAPSLMSFTCLVFNPLSREDIFEVIFDYVEFPVLTSLTLRVARIPRRMTNHQLSGQIYMPALTNLHISSSQSVYQRECAAVIALCRRFPSLDSLMLSGNIVSKYTCFHPDVETTHSAIRQIIMQRFLPTENAQEFVGRSVRKVDIVTLDGDTILLPVIKSLTFEEWKEYGYIACTRFVNDSATMDI